MWRAAVWVLAVGCGRVDFDAVRDAAADAAPDAMPDAAPAIAMVDMSAQALAGCPDDPTVSLGQTQAGALLIACSATDIGALVSVTDSQGNAYAPLFAASQAACGITVYCFYATNIAGSGPLDLVLHGTELCASTLNEYSGVTTVATSSKSAGTGSLGDSGPVTSAAPDVLYFAAQTHCEQLVTTPGAGWQHHQVADEEQSMSQALSSEDIIGGPATVNGQFVFTPPETLGWAVGAAAFTP